METIDQTMAVGSKLHIHKKIERDCTDLFESHLISVILSSTLLSWDYLMVVLIAALFVECSIGSMVCR